MFKGSFFRVICNRLLILLLIYTILGVFNSTVFAEENAAVKEDTICVVYISGIGCSNCAITDPVLFGDMLRKYPNLIVLEYEIFRSNVENREVKDAYFLSYAANERPGVPFLIFNTSDSNIGRFNVKRRLDELSKDEYNACPMPDGSSVNFRDLEPAALYGKINIWTKNRVLMPEGSKRGIIPKELLLNDDISVALNNLKYTQISPVPVKISEGEIKFQNAVKINGWRLQWNGNTPVNLDRSPKKSRNIFLWILFSLILIGILTAIFEVKKNEKGDSIKFNVRGKRGDWLVVLISASVLTGFFIFAKSVSPDFLEKAGYQMPLPLFTFLIGLVDGFNPCNMFVLTCLLVLLVTTSHDRKRLYVVSLSFIFMVYIFYFLFMAAWLNVFKTMQFVTPLRIAIAIIALVAGLINCKELLFFKKGISLTIPEQQKGPLLKRINSMKKVITNGSYPLLISSSLGLAALSSIVELPCTAGFPIIYTGILAGKTLQNSVWYYLYLGLYNIFYVLPLLVIITVFIYTFRARYISQRQVEIMKFIGGFIMIALGIVLLINPGLLGLKIG